ncbi:MAG: hypothetical protein ACE5PT_06255 [Gemmatimonadales bacterium]
MQAWQKIVLGMYTTNPASGNGSREYTRRYCELEDARGRAHRLADSVDEDRAERTATAET